MSNNILSDEAFRSPHIRAFMEAWDEMHQRIKADILAQGLPTEDAIDSVFTQVGIFMVQCMDPVRVKPIWEQWRKK